MHLLKGVPGQERLKKLDVINVSGNVEKRDCELLIALDFGSRQYN
jgi:hypothetical protein